ncbi:MAG: hypothetical protein HYV07_29215 [Deltaproteobacteria bacterium]|nr:hypothetical protein [Deltaproteobacteria bacterium]
MKTTNTSDPRAARSHSPEREAFRAQTTSKPTETTEPTLRAAPPERSRDSYGTVDGRATRVRALLDSQPRSTTTPQSSTNRLDPSVRPTVLGRTPDQILGRSELGATPPSAPEREHRGSRRVEGQIYGQWNRPSESAPLDRSVQDPRLRSRQVDRHVMTQETGQAYHPMRDRMPTIDAGERAMRNVNLVVGVASAAPAPAVTALSVGLTLGGIVDRTATKVLGKTIGEAAFDLVHGETPVAEGAKGSDSPIVTAGDLVSLAASAVGGPVAAATSLHHSLTSSEEGSSDTTETSTEASSDTTETSTESVPDSSKTPSCSPDPTLPPQYQGLIQDSGLERTPSFERTHGRPRPEVSNPNPDTSETSPEVIPSKRPGVVDPMMGKTDHRAEAYARVRSRDELYSDPNPSTERGVGFDPVPGYQFIPPRGPIRG